jgi:Ulp1 protease family, C-terminal catalytic domain
VVPETPQVAREQPLNTETAGDSTECIRASERLVPSTQPLAKRKRSPENPTYPAKRLRSARNKSSLPYSVQEISDTAQGDNGSDIWKSLEERVQAGDPQALLAQSLRPGEWLNDLVIEEILFGMKWSPQFQVLQASFLYEKFAPKAHLLSVKSPTKRFLVPVCRHFHWTLLDVDIESGNIDHYDPRSSYQSRRATENHQACSICNLMAETVDEAQKAAGTLPASRQWTFRVNEQSFPGHDVRPLSPQQEKSDVVQCGAIICFVADCLSNNLNPSDELCKPIDLRLKWTRQILQRETSKPKENLIGLAEIPKNMRETNEAEVTAKDLKAASTSEDESAASSSPLQYPDHTPSPDGESAPSDRTPVIPSSSTDSRRETSPLAREIMRFDGTEGHPHDGDNTPAKGMAV